MGSNPFLNELKLLSSKIKKALNNKTNNWLVGAIASSKNGKKTFASIDHLYEIMCYFYILSNLNPSANITFIPGSASEGFRFPQKPASKGSYAYFEIRYNGNEYLLYLGVEIPAKDSTHTPDITFLQKTNCEEILLGMWEAKHHEKDDFPSNEIHQISYWSSIFKSLPKYKQRDIYEELFPYEFQVRAVVTNAKKRQRPQSISLEKCFEDGISIVYDFDGTVCSSGPIPSRVEHLNHA
jgi:hypothetical protein